MNEDQKPPRSTGRYRKNRFPLSEDQLADVAERMHVIAMESDDETAAIAAASVIVGMASINNHKG